jgi:hypothetical protein
MLKPPTDNLYKFSAIFGLLLLVTGFVMESQTRRAFNEAKTAIMVEDAKIGEQKLPRRADCSIYPSNSEIMMAKPMMVHVSNAGSLTRC